ncbi:MAG: AAA family ATPase, partial [Candidatus Omnitrophica bacterium]|nr:AAA family ATPase [Candidatus Omnitrophota bacterium]
LRLEIDSMPAEIDNLHRGIVQLEIEKQALKKEKDKSSQERLEKIEEELEVDKKDLENKKKQWEKEKSVIVKIQEIKEKLEELKNEASSAEKVGDLDRVARIKYGEIIELDKEFKKYNDELNKISKGNAMLRQEIDEEDIARVVSEWTGIPLTKLMEADAQKLVKMEERLKLKVVGQDEAIEAISSCIRRSRSGLGDEKKPMGSFIFMGPTGVGKTKLAKALAWFLFDDEEALIRIDMSEYMEKFSVSRLMGAPPGYVGYEEGGQLTEKVRRRPYAVILLDEIEKAHPDVFNILLAILDEGRLTDGQGRTVNFKNTVIIMTSNIGQEILQARSVIGFSRPALETSDGIPPEAGKDTRKDTSFTQIKEQLLEEVRKTLRPEFINRLDDIIVFNPLSKEDIYRIVDIELAPLYNKLAQRKIQLELTKKAKDFIVEKGFDINYGARPLKRTIQKHIQDPLSLRLLNGSLKDGEKVIIDLDADKNLSFKGG